MMMVIYNNKRRKNIFKRTRYNIANQHLLMSHKDLCRFLIGEFHLHIAL